MFSSVDLEKSSSVLGLRRHRPTNDVKKVFNGKKKKKNTEKLNIKTGTIKIQTVC